MPQEMTGRRIPLDEVRSPFMALKQAGDYCGPITIEGEGVPGIWFLLPIARDPDVPHEAKCLHHVCSPPHRFIEEPDGTITIRESIGAGANGYYWHGYLTNGVWMLEKGRSISTENG